MTTMNVSLPSELKEYVDDQVQARGYGTTSEYVRDLIRRDRERDRLRSMLLDGLESAPAVTADEAYFATLRRRLMPTDT